MGSADFRIHFVSGATIQSTATDTTGERDGTTWARRDGEKGMYEFVVHWCDEWDLPLRYTKTGIRKKAKAGDGAASGNGDPEATGGDANGGRQEPSHTTPKARPPDIASGLV